MIRELLPDAAIGTDLIAGFPGEDDAAFAAHAGVRRGEPDHLRPRVPVLGAQRDHGGQARRPQPVAADHRRRAPASCGPRATRKRVAFARRFDGAAAEVLVETTRDPRTGALRGYTRNYLRAHLRGTRTPGWAASFRSACALGRAALAWQAGRRMTELQRRPWRPASGIASSGPSTSHVAVTHRSFSPDAPNNETLEFLGDAVLALAMADLLMRRFPVGREGDLSKLRAGLVNAETLAQKARTARARSLAAAREGRGEERRARQGVDPRRPATRRCSAPSTSTPATRPRAQARRAPLRDRPDDEAAAGLRDYKTRLQELTQRLLPRHAGLPAGGGERPRSRQAVRLRAEHRRAQPTAGASATARRPAEQAAAMQALDALSRARRRAE